MNIYCQTIFPSFSWFVYKYLWITHHFWCFESALVGPGTGLWDLPQRCALLRPPGAHGGPGGGGGGAPKKWSYLVQCFCTCVYIYICSYDMSGCICYQLLTRLTGRLNDAVLRLHICVYIYVHRYIHRYIRYRKKQEYIYIQLYAIWI